MKGRPLIPFAIIAFLGILLMVAFSTIGLQQRANMDEEGDEPIVIDDPVEYGQGLVESSCLSCHANDLSGTASAPAINNLDLSHDEIVNVVSNGQGEGMPSFSGNFEPEEIDAIAEYLLSLTE
ncbi:c-type cytochrome [Shouchella patagoniensis]|uniref:c-type cytochrome n=1 Tax=Shouchella patagoniensis TaxID=228576 RepID=UPI000995DD26|nr:cytochrome c [Shouchella patagoniensis]